MPSKSDRTAPLYHARWFEDEDSARTWMERYIRKYRGWYPEYEFDIAIEYKKFPYEDFKKWHASIKKVDNEN